MTAQVFSFLRRFVAPRDWSTQELAEFYRVESALIQASLRVVTARGLTDEGEPWFVFCRAEDDEVIIHFARIDGRYLISAPAYCGTAMGRDFRALVRSTLERHPVLRPQRNGDNLFLHPAALLVVLVTSALLKSGHASEVAPARSTAASATNEKSWDAVVASAPITALMSSVGAQHEILALIATAVTIAAPVRAEPVTIVMSATTQLPDIDSQPHHRLVSSTLLHESHAVQTVDGGSVAPVVPLQQAVVASSVDATPATLAHAGLEPDAGSVLSLHSSFAGPAMLAALPGSAFLDSALPDPTAGVRLVPLTALSSIAKPDMDLLHALNVPDNVPYTPALPIALSTVVHTGVHVATINPIAEHASSTGQPPTAAPPLAAPVASTGIPEAAQGPAVVGAPPAAASADAGAHAITVPSTATAAPNLSVVLTTVEQFQAVSTHPVVVFTTDAAIFYDAAAVTGNLSAVKSFTYDFGDGFSISLIGLPAEFAHIGIHV